MNTKILITMIAGAAAVLAPTTAEANRGYQPGNCAVYAEEAAKTARADARLGSDMQASFAEALGVYGDTLDAAVKAGMEQTYAQSAAFGWDKATVDRKMAEGTAAVRKGWTGPTMEPGRFYTDHLLALEACGSGSASAGHISMADKQAMDTMLSEVFAKIR